jgi:YD repeat-containing protein
MKSLRRVLALLVLVCLPLGGLVATDLVAPPRAEARVGTVTNLAHLNFLLDDVSPPVTARHTTYRQAEEPALVMPWTYADARNGGTFERVGGGPLDPATGDWGQGAYNTDDITRAAVVYLRHWRQTKSRDSRAKAYELLRSVAYMQTATGPNAGNSVLWIQPDGELNPSPEPLELPDPSDSGPSYWQARTVWAFGEGYAAFKSADPAFARFLQNRLRLTLAALRRDVLSKYGTYVVADGVRLPAWLIVNGADATSEAVLGLSAYADAAPGDRRARRMLGQFADGIQRLAAGGPQQWPYGAILPWAESRSLWHAWASQTGAALASSAETLGRPKLLRTATREAISFDPTLLTAGGADNGWLPTPADRVQIAYGVDSRVQSLLAVADAGRTRAAADLAAIEAAWFFGANRAGAPMYNPATGVTYDGLQPDGSINRNSGAESTIHGLLTMLALDAQPRVRARAVGVTRVQSRDGLTVVEAESAVVTTGSVVTPTSPWTGESQWSGGKYLRLEAGQRASLVVPRGSGPRLVEPVSWQVESGRGRSVWSVDERRLGVLRHRVGDQGITAASGALLPQLLDRTVPAAGGALVVTARRAPLQLDAVILRPVVSRMALTGATGRTELVHSASRRAERAVVGAAGTRATVRAYDARGRLVEQRRIDGRTRIELPARGMAVVVG